MKKSLAGATKVGLGYSYCLLKPRNFAKAIPFLEAARDQGASSPAGYADLGFCYLLGRITLKKPADGIEKARTAFEAALALRPNYHPALHGLALLDLQKALNNPKCLPFESLARLEVVALKPGQCHPSLLRDAACLYSVIGGRQHDEAERMKALARAGELELGLGGPTMSRIPPRRHHRAIRGRCVGPGTPESFLPARSGGLGVRDESQGVGNGHGPCAFVPAHRFPKSARRAHSGRWG